MIIGKSKIAGGVAAAALVMASAGPANARGYGGYGGGRHHHDGPDAAAVIGVIAGIGIIAAIASAASAKKQQETNRDYRGYDPRYDDRSYDNRGYDNPRYDSRSNDGRYDSGRSYSDEDAAVDACATAARNQASNTGGYSEVRDITGVRPFGNGWDVTGTVSQRSSYRAGEGRLRSFRCVWENGRIGSVTFN